MKILVVDDSEDNQTIISFFLQKEGHECEVADGGKEAIKKVYDEGYKPELILMDYNMPGACGDRVSVQFRDKGFEAPILLCTASDIEMEELCENHLIFKILRKPFRIKEFNDIVT